jgi:hypothetical protein
MFSQNLILFEWVKDGNIEDLKTYFETRYCNLHEMQSCPPEVLVPDTVGRVMLHWACLYGQYAIVKWMLDVMDIDIHVRDD